MENKIMEKEIIKKDNPYAIPIAIIIAGVMALGVITYNNAPNIQATLIDGGNILPLEAEKEILATLTANGSIDPLKLPEVTELNLLWAFGLANKNQILEDGPIMDASYDGPTNMASVGGWTATTGSVMDHYNQHVMVTLTLEEQALVKKIAKGIYRPCCNNSTYFPDCNHGMAMLGLLEYLASQGATEEEMWDTDITVNMSWFPNQYQMINQYFEQKGVAIKSINPQELLGAEYSSSSGFAKIAAQISQTKQPEGGSGCDI